MQIKSYDRRAYWAMLFVTFCLCLFLFWQVPLFSDDFEFADLVRTKSFSEVIYYILYYGNGRLLGNIFSIFMVNSGVISAFIKAFTVVGIIALLPRVLRIHTSMAFLLSLLLVLGVAPQIFAQVFIWTSGFANYILSVFISLLGAYLVQTETKNWSKKVLLGAIGFIGQLFVEHSTIINLLVSAGLASWFHFRKKENQRNAAMCWFAGCAIGAVTMFLLPSIFYVEGNRTEGYRDVHFDSLLDMVEFAIGQLFFMIVTLSRCTALFAATSWFGWTIHFSIIY